MAFDSDKFLKTKFRDRTEDVPVPELKAFFPEGEKPVWTVKCLTSEEVVRSNDEVDNLKHILAIVKKLSSAIPKQKASGVGDLTGLDKDKLPEGLVKRISYLMYGSVSPECNREMAVKIADINYDLFFKLTNKIHELSGKGKLGE